MNSSVERFLEKIKVSSIECLLEENPLQSFAEDESGERGYSPSIIIKPKNTEEVREIVNYAREHHMPLIPVSSSSPHYRGDTVPLHGGAIVDLSKMKRILLIDRRHRIAVIEPGVKFRDFFSALEKNGLRPLAPFLPREGKSVLSVSLDREPVTLPRYQWDSSDPLRCVEVVFGTGDIFRTGEACGQYSEDFIKEGKIIPTFPLGPHQVDYHRIIQGSQGSIGIVTWASLKVELKSEREEFYYVKSRELTKICLLASRLIKLEIADYLIILNESGFCHAIESGSGDNMVFYLIFSISGLQRRPEERMSYLRDEVFKLSRDFSLQVDSRDGLKDIFRVPGKERCWREREGFCFREIFFLTGLKKIEDTVRALCEMIEEKEFFIISIQPVTQATSWEVNFTFYYPSGSREKRRRADEMERKMVKVVMSRGGFFSRPYYSWRYISISSNPVYENVLRKVKKIFDPDGILNPGRFWVER